MSILASTTLVAAVFISVALVGAFGSRLTTPGSHGREYLDAFLRRTPVQRLDQPIREVQSRAMEFWTAFLTRPATRDAAPGVNVEKLTDPDSDPTQASSLAVLPQGLHVDVLADTPEPPGQSEVSSRRAYDDEFSNFFREEYRKFVRQMMKSGAIFEEAEAAVQQAMSEAYTRWPLLANPSVWVWKAANIHQRIKIKTDRVRSQKKAESAHQESASVEPDENRRFMTALRHLPDEQREIMALTFDGYTPTDIANLLQEPVSAVRSRLHAHSKLRHELLGPDEEV